MDISIFLKYKFNLFLLILCGIFFNGKAQERRLNVLLSREVFSDRFDLIFRLNGDMAINDQDALKIGEGYVVLAGLYSDGKYISVEERPWVPSSFEVKLYIKGYSKGSYRLKMEGMDVILKDNLMKISKVIAGGNDEYFFTIDPEIRETYGGNRFSLLFNYTEAFHEPQIENNKLMVYPNPCAERLFLKIKPFKLKNCEVEIRNISGEIIWRRSFDVSDQEVLELDLQFLRQGMYLIDLKDLQNSQFFKIVKFLKQ